MSDQLPRGRDVSVPIQQIVLQATGLSLLMLLLPLGIYMLVWGWAGLFSDWNTWLFVALTLIFVLAHEGFHAIGWKYWGEIRWQDIQFGMKWESLAPYTHATAPMKASAYRFGAVLPGIMTGVVPFLMALVLGSGMMAILGAVLISGAVGDVYVLWIMRDVNPNALVLDHPENAGCIVVREGN